MKLDINYKRKIGKFANMCRLNNMLLNNQREQITPKGKYEKHFQANRNTTTKTFVFMQQKHFLTEKDI